MKKNRNYFEFSQFVEKLINKYNKTQNTNQDYNTGIYITRTEIHTIEIIGLNKDINITEIANIQGITKGAVSKMIYKLLNKGLVIKIKAPNSDAEVRILLTDKGKIAYEEHKKFHQKINKKFFDNLNDFSDEQYEKVMNLFKDLEYMLDKNSL